MARGAAQARRKRTKAEAARRRRRAQTSTPARATEQALFFTRLRRQAKWVFVVLALVFALGFVVFGVGSGGGIGLGDLFNSNNTASSNVSVSGARKRIQKNPNDAKAYRDLSTALQAEGDLDGAIDALKHFTKLRPRNTDAISELAGLYSSQGSALTNRINSAQAESQEAQFLSQVNTGITLGNKQIVEPNQVFQAVTNVTNDRLTKLYTKQQDDLSQAEKLAQRIVALRPRDANAQLNLGYAAYTAGDATGAIAAYERYIELAPEGANVAQVRQLIKQLRQAAKQQPGIQGG